MTGCSRNSTRRRSEGGCSPNLIPGGGGFGWARSLGLLVLYDAVELCDDGDDADIYEINKKQ